MPTERWINNKGWAGRQLLEQVNSGMPNHPAAQGPYDVYLTMYRIDCLKYRIPFMMDYELNSDAFGPHEHESACMEMQEDLATVSRIHQIFTDPVGAAVSHEIDSDYIQDLIAEIRSIHQKYAAWYSKNALQPIANFIYRIHCDNQAYSDFLLETVESDPKKYAEYGEKLF